MEDERKSREELIAELAELRKRCARQENILSSIHPYVLLVVSPDRTIQMCTRSVQKVFGYEVEELIGKTTNLLYFDRRSSPDRPKEIYEILEEEGYHVGLATGKKKGGGTLTLEIVTGKLGNGGGAVLLVHEVPEYRMQQEMLRQRCTSLEKAYEELKTLDALKDTFLSSVSHEFRTPLTSIRSFAEILLRYPGEDSQTQKEFLSIIQSESERLGRMIDNVLDLSKIKAGKMQWRFQQLGAEAIIHKAIQTVKSLLAAQRLEIETDVEAGLPEFPGDEDRVQQVLTNLLSNAIKFSEEGGKIRIEVDLLQGRRVGDRTDFVHISVSDSGVGILPEDLPVIFERFWTGADTLEEKPKGTGLGLPICKEIISAHRGDIWAESVYGRGSTFHISLPAYPICRTPAEGLEPSVILPEHDQLC